MEVSGLVGGGETFSHQKGNQSSLEVLCAPTELYERESMVGKKDHKGITYRQVSFGVVRSKE